MSANEIKTAELRPDRHRATARRGTTSIAGDLTAELTYGTFDDFLAAVFCGTWTTNVLKTGTARTSFSILKRYLDIGVDTLYTGCQINTIKLACPLQEKITSTFSLIGLTEESYTVPSGATFDAASTTDFMTTLDGSLSLGGSSFGCATDLNLQLTNNIAAKYALMSASAYAIKIGMIDVTGDFSAYIEDDTLKTAFRSDSDEVFSIVLTDKASGGNTYTIAIPRARFTSVSADSFNADDLGIQQLQFTGLLDTTSSTELSITRSP